MAGALWILSVLVLTGLVLFLLDRVSGSRRQSSSVEDPGEPDEMHKDNGQEDEAADTECCGLHLVCEKSLPPSSSPVYFDDEELDRFAGRPSQSYSDCETEEFRDVMLTLLPHDRLPWAQSVARRGIELPSVIREELSLLLSEQ